MAPVERRTHNVVKTMNINLKNHFSGPTSGQVVDATPAFQTRVVWIPLKGKYLYMSDINNSIYKYMLRNKQ